MELQDNIKRYRELRKYSVIELAEKMGIGKQNIYNWESGANRPDLKGLTDLAKALDVTVSELLGENPTSVQEPSNNKEMNKEDVYRSLVESNTDYRLIPKTILDGEYRIMLESELADRKKLYDEAIASKNKLISQLEREIADLRSGKVVINTEASRAVGVPAQ